ncbi:MAG: hypothetical protein M3Y82_13755 [Verrucomicrobiota bacterium]|nr:hypothetical protein [Verrucomicrobiota bacterium]
MKPYEQITCGKMDLSWLIGHFVTEVSFHEPELWFFNFGEKGNIGAECLWRIIHHGRIRLCSNDHGQKFGHPSHIDATIKSAELLAGRFVTAFRVREVTTDITVEFSDDWLLEIIPDSSGYESWQVNEAFGVRYFGPCFL